MAEYIPAAIRIGGSITGALAAELAATIIEASALPEYDDGVAPSATAAWLESIVGCERVGVLHLVDNEARFGRFERLERWLVEHNVAFDRQTDAKYEFDGEVTSFRPGIGLVERTATQNGEPTVRLVEVERVRHLLRAALRERSPEKVRAAAAALDEALGPEVSSLPPFIVD